MSEQPEIKGVIPTYYFIITDKLNKIYEAWDNNDPYLALERALKLVPFLPVKLKKEIAPEKERIRKLFQNSISGQDFNSVQLKSSLLRHNTASQEVEPFIDKLTTLLDDNHLLTLSYGVPTRTGSIQKIGESVYGQKP